MQKRNSAKVQILNTRLLSFLRDKHKIEALRGKYPSMVGNYVTIEYPGFRSVSFAYKVDEREKVYFSAIALVEEGLAKLVDAERLREEFNPMITIEAAGKSVQLKTRISIGGGTNQIADKSNSLVWDTIINPLLWYFTDSTSKQ